VVELGCINIAHVAGTMARCSAAPREGHMYIILRMFTYCKKQNESKVMFDPLTKDFLSLRWDWSQFYPDIRGEILLPNQLDPRLICFVIRRMECAMQESTTGVILIFLNGAPKYVL
jgi:hypothetical protein